MQGMRRRLIIVCIIVGVILAWDNIRDKSQSVKEVKNVRQEVAADKDGGELVAVSGKEEEVVFPELKYNYAINNKRIKCINNANIFERYKCEVNASYSWEKEIKKSLSYLKNRMSEENYNKLIENQQLWNKYEENTEKLLYAFIISKSGNYNQQIGYNYLANVKRQRNEFLRTIYNFYSANSGNNIKDVNQYIADETFDSDNSQINKYLTYLQARTKKDEFVLVSQNQEIWESLLESDKEIVRDFIQGGIVSELSGEDDVKNLYKNRAVLLRNIYNQYYKTIQTH